MRTLETAALDEFFDLFFATNRFELLLTAECDVFPDLYTRNTRAQAVDAREETSYGLPLSIAVHALRLLLYHTGSGQRRNKRTPTSDNEARS